MLLCSGVARVGMEAVAPTPIITKIGFVYKRSLMLKYHKVILCFVLITMPQFSLTTPFAPPMLGVWLYATASLLHIISCTGGLLAIFYWMGQKS